MAQDTLQADLLGAPTAIGAARLAILASRSQSAHAGLFIRDQVILLPDLRPTSIERCAEHLAALPHPLQLQESEVIDGVLALQHEPIADPLQLSEHERMHAAHRPFLTLRGADLSAKWPASATVLVDGRDERLLVRGDAFDRWFMAYTPPCSYSGGPADEYVAALDLGDAVRASRPDYVFRFFRARAVGASIIVRDIRDGEGEQCARCGQPATKVAVMGDAIAEALCTECSERIPSNVLAQLLSRMAPEERAEFGQGVEESLHQLTASLPDGASPPPKFEEQRALLNRIRKLLDEL